MTDGEALVRAYTAAWQHRQTTGDASSWVLRREIDRVLTEDRPLDEATQKMVRLLVRAWDRGIPPERLWRPLMRVQVVGVFAMWRMLARMLRTPKKLRLPSGLRKVGESHDDDTDHEVALQFHDEAGTQAVLAWAWTLAHDPADLDDDDEVPVWLDVTAGTETAAVMLGARRAGTTVVPAGTDVALRRLDTRRRRCVPDGWLDVRRHPDGRFEVVELVVELP
ncbi:hypothetical protein [Mumia quercus]|uniref:hypothetical protein n=1 Tax=Mumia quercus TaxID=2976125 RepID=UPI0021D3380D|nr:hypothetical protein [Mumia quercus]